MPAISTPQAIKIDAVICRGSQSASGIQPGYHSPEGNLRLQNRGFIRQGFDIPKYLGAEPYWGTVNCYIGEMQVDPLTYFEKTRRTRRGTVMANTHLNPVATRWDIRIRNIKWYDTEPAEDFFFLKGRITCNRKNFPCLVYFPKPIGKRDDFHLMTILEIIAPPLPLRPGHIYGQRVSLTFPGRRLALVKPSH